MRKASGGFYSVRLRISSGRGGGDVYELAAQGMDEAYGVGVEGGAAYEGARAAVEPVAEEGAAEVGHVYAYLVRAARLGDYAQQREAAEALRDLPVRDARAAGGVDAEALLLAEARDGRVHRAALRGRGALAEREVFPPEIIRVQYAPQPLVHIAGLGRAHEAARVPVEAVHGVEGRVRAQIRRRERADGGLALLAPAVDGHAGALVDDEEVLVLPDDVELAGHGGEGALLGVADVYLERVARAEYVYALRGLAVHAHGALAVLEPRHQPRREAERPLQYAAHAAAVLLGRDGIAERPGAHSSARAAS